MIDLRSAIRTSKANQTSKWAGVHDRILERCTPQVKEKFQVKPGSSVFTIGSCFARNMERHLSVLGYTIPMLDFSVPKVEWASVPQGILNKYTPPAIYQELAWVASILKRDGVVRKEDCDQFLYQVGELCIDNNLSGFVPVTIERFLARRQELFDCFKHAFSSDCVTITLGLIECWYDQKLEIYIQESPAKNLGLMKAVKDQVFFVRLTQTQCLEFVNKSLDLLKELNPDADILMTVSPVPLDATFTEEDVITANSHSKSVLRSTVGEIVAENPNIGYFPSYESIMLTRDWSVFEADLRHVTDEAIGQLVIDLSGSYFSTENPEVVEALKERLSLKAQKSNQYHRKTQLVELALQKQDFDEAISLLEESLDVAPEKLKSRVKTRIANVCLLNNDLRLAEVWIDSAMDDGVKNASAFFIKARVCKAKGDEKEARRYAVAAQELNPNRQEITDFLSKL